MDERVRERALCGRAENSLGHDGENNNKFVLQRVKNTLCVHTELLKQPRGVLFIFLLLFKSASKGTKHQPLSSSLTPLHDIISPLALPPLH